MELAIVVFWQLHSTHGGQVHWYSKNQVSRPLNKTITYLLQSALMTVFSTRNTCHLPYILRYLYIRPQWSFHHKVGQKKICYCQRMRKKVENCLDLLEPGLSVGYYLEKLGTLKTPETYSKLQIFPKNPANQLAYGFRKKVQTTYLCK